MDFHLLKGRHFNNSSTSSSSFFSSKGALFHELSRTLYDSDTTIYMCVRERLQMRVNCLCIGFTDDSD
ncbi:hypothetical protein YC2023_013872 [Brassica napus]